MVRILLQDCVRRLEALFVLLELILRLQSVDQIRLPGVILRLSDTHEELLEQFPLLVGELPVLGHLRHHPEARAELAGPMQTDFDVGSNINVSHVQFRFTQLSLLPFRR